MSCVGASDPLLGRLVVPQRVLLRPQIAICICTEKDRGSLNRARAFSSQNDDSQDIAVENLPTSYCDDFVCTSSPAVEMTIKAFARDIERGNGVWTRSLLSKDIVYEDMFRKSKGIELFSCDFVPKVCQPRSGGQGITVLSMRMLENASSSTARISWRLRGTLKPSGIEVDVDMTTDIEMNLLTGQIIKRTEQWSLQRCSAIAKLAWIVSRAVWTATNLSKDVKNTTGSVLDSLTSMDEMEDDMYTTADPRDPMKFFQQNDTFKDDAIMFIAFLLMIYIVLKGYSIVFQ